VTVYAITVSQSKRTNFESHSATRLIGVSIGDEMLDCSC
jgi:hypothetical protein